MTQAVDGTDGPPGRPLDSGFAYKPSSSFPQLHLDQDARNQVLEKMDSVDAARLRAAETSSSTYIG